MLNQLYGNAEIKQTLKSIVTSGRFPHAFIIEGEEGSGRRTLAKIITAAALCESDSDVPCGKCRICDLVNKDGHCDALTYGPEGATFKVSTVREIRENAYIMPIEAKRKVNILLDCDKMNESAQNAFLKVLEEPPRFMVFILICQNAASLLPTVRSRCVTLTMQNPDSDDAVDCILAKTDKPLDDIREALDSAHGNIGRAMKILSGEAAKSVKAAADFMEAVRQNDRICALKILKPFEKDRLGFNSFLTELRLAAQEECKLLALEKGKLSVARASRVLRLTENLEASIRRHIGQPLSISLNCTALCAQIFSDL